MVVVTARAMQLALCRSCSARVVWIRTQSGKRMPLDADPSPKGDFVIVKHIDGGTLAVLVTPKTVEFYHDIKERYLSHFATCPDAGKWRRRD